jgi:hypothetical protein
MNGEDRRNTFHAGLAALVQDAEEIIAGTGRDPFAGVGDHLPHEHDTRRLFIDRLLALLGWKLGPYGNVIEEARLKVDTTRFMDYVGVAEGTQAPLMIVEAKAWDKPYVTARVPGTRETDGDLIVGAIRHMLDNKPACDSPVVKLWHDYLFQISRYVRDMKTTYGHDTPRAVLASGPWLIVFTDPVTTFVDGAVSGDHVVIFRLTTYVQQADKLFDLLHRSVLAKDIPFPLRPAQLTQYVELASINTVFHGLHVHFEKTGSPFHHPQPQILVYPIVVIERDDGVLITSMTEHDGFPLAYKKARSEDAEDQDELRLDAHLAEVASCAKELLSDCAAELGGELTTSPLDRFSGYPSDSKDPNAPTLLVSRLRGQHDDWLMVTGICTHYLTASPIIPSCRFHSWAACQAIGTGIGKSAISVRSLSPRSLFIDQQPHHCAHQGLQDRRTKRCQIMQIDQRTCCQTCVYVSACWAESENPKLPCGT